MGHVRVEGKATKRLVRFFDSARISVRLVAETVTLVELRALFKV